MCDQATGVKSLGVISGAIGRGRCQFQTSPIDLTTRPRETGWQVFVSRRVVGTALFAVVIGTCISVSTLVAKPDRTREISIHNIHTKDTITVTYKRNGRYVPAAMKKINWVMRDWRRNKPTTMDPKLIDLMWEMHTELGSRKPIHLISGYRSPKTNNMLRKTRGGQARRSRHIVGKAADIHFPDVPIKKLRYSGLIRERGGVGYYPTSAIPFVHVDTGRVRHWPRMGRYELALLFPNGRSKHRPRSGGAISKRDVRYARKKYTRLAGQIADFRAGRGKPGQGSIQVASAQPAPKLVRRPLLAARPKPAKRPVRVASLTPPALAPARTKALNTRYQPSLRVKDRQGLSDLVQNVAYAPEPKLLARPKPVERPQPQTARLDEALSVQRVQDAIGSLMSRLFSADLLPSETTAPQNEANTPPTDLRDNTTSNWIAAPAYDEEHPEELSYRPFPLAPLLTNSASPDDPILAHLHAPDPEATLELMTDDADSYRMQFTPNKRQAALLWATQFSGKAVNVDALHRQSVAEKSGKSLGLASRRVRTSQR